MKERIFIQSVSWVLTLCMLFLLLPVFPLDVTAVGGGDVFQMDAECQVLNFVDEEVFNAANHVARLPEEETLSSYAFLNSDGSKTIYYLNENAKYYDSTGIVREKNISLTASLNAYTVTQNDVQLSIPTDPASGIEMSYAGYDISLVPQGGSSTTVQRTDNSVGYINYYGKGTALRYTPTYSGIKEDILLAIYTGVSSFTFKLNTDGLRLYSQNGRFFLSASANSEMKIWLGDLVVYDAQCNMSKGTMTATAITEGQQYLLTISVDEAFLTDKNTIYPVVIDPTLTVSDSTHGSNAIEDAPLFSGFANTNHGSYIYDRVGYVNSNYGTARTVIRPTGLLNSSIYQNLTLDKLTSATFHIRDASGSGSATVNLHPLTNSAWTESGVTWNNIGAYNATSYATASVGGNSMASFDITSLVAEWKQGSINPQCGFILINANESLSQRALIACEGSSATTMPYIALTYTDYANVTVSVLEGCTATLNTSDLSGTITWTVNNSSVATVSSSGVVTGVKAGKTFVTAYVNGVEARTYAIYVTIPDGIYYIKNNNSGRYLGVEDGVFSTSSNIELQTKATTNPTRLQQLWNIKYVNNGSYEISALFYNDPCLHYSGSKISLYSSFSVLNHWMISYDDNGYLIQQTLDYNVCLYPTGSGTAAGTVVTAGSFANATNAYKWTFEQQTSEAGLILCNTDTHTYETSSASRCVAIGQSVSLRTLGIQYFYYSNYPAVFSHSWHSDDEQIVTVDSDTGAVTGIAPGSTTISVYLFDHESGDEYAVTYNIIVTGSAPGRYGIQNKYSKLYVEALSATQAAPLYQQTLYSKELQIWDIALADDGYYYITLDNYSSLCLGVNGTSVALYNGQSGDNTKWKITLVSTDTDGRYAYTLSPKANEAYSLSLPAQTTSTNALLTLKAKTAVSGTENQWYMAQLLPTSGDEVVADDVHWPPADSSMPFNAIQNRINCYGYAIDNQLDTREGLTVDDNEIYDFQQPGAYNDRTFSLLESDLHEDPQKLLEAVEDDFKKFGQDNNRQMIFTRIGRYEQCPEGTYKVALVIAPNIDYHWYRQDPDGFWSHKLAIFENDAGQVRTIDGSNNLIIDPQIADRHEAQDYTLFIGYFAVTPWSQYYDYSNDYMVVEITVEDRS